MNKILNQIFSASLEIIVYEWYSNTARGVEKLFMRTAKAFMQRYGGKFHP
jgi:hypothetical protein